MFFFFLNIIVSFFWNKKINIDWHRGKHQLLYTGPLSVSMKHTYDVSERYSELTNKNEKSVCFNLISNTKYN